MLALDVFSYEAAGFVQGIMIISLVVLISAIGSRKSGEKNKLLRYVPPALLVISAGTLIWLLCNKEAFHWNYDIATGKPVDHYSTYGRCFVTAVIAIVSNAAATLLHFVKRKTK